MKYLINKVNPLQKIVKIATASIVIGALILGSGLFFHGNNALGSTVKKEVVEFRIIGTTDLHGQLNSKDYEKGVDYNNGGLARAIDLINKARNELPKDNTVTLDAGDVLFDYTTEYIFSEDQEEIQPIYEAMTLVGYDAITLGNHDFDYGYNYILNQLNGSGLRSITVVSNVTDSKTGEYPFLENMLITRQMKTSSGKKVEVTIGIIGHTIPTLTSKTHSYTGILKTEDMVENAKKQAVKLKEMGADIIISLSHTGIGPENPELNFKNVAYALSKIPEIDVVIAGHEHNMFPTSDMTSPYYKLPNVDKKTYLMNGKNVVMASDRGSAIGIVDLTLEVVGDEVTIVNRKSEIRKVTAKNTTEDKGITSLYGYWEERLLEYSTDVIGELKKGSVIHNYYGLLGDNAAIQLLNNSKIHYALTYANTTGAKNYKNYPIIAASTYDSYGVNSVDDFITITDKITESELSSIQPYNNYLYIYTITGKQLREWLEWTASAYETTQGKAVWQDETMSTLIKDNNLKSLIKEEWLDDWSNFYVFDGVEYTINPRFEPRYDFSGHKISTSKRIESLSYNGVDVTDDMTFLLATNKITKPTEANKGVEKQTVLAGFIRAQSILSKYIELIAKNGEIIPTVDNNWRVDLYKNYRFIIKAPYYADSLFKGTSWYVSSLMEKDQYNYYMATYGEYQDKEAPNIIISPLVVNTTATSYDVAVYVTDNSDVVSAKVLSGEYDANYSGWVVGKDVKNKVFTVYKNGIYTIYAEDSYGNKSTKNITIDNFNENLLSKPTVVSYTNRKTKISGTAEPNKTIIFEAITGSYTSKVDLSGKFSYELPGQPSGSTVKVYIKDAEKGLESEKVTVPVKRTGPNQPSANQFNNNMYYITGTINDIDADVIAIIGDIVYVSDLGGKEIFEKNIEINNGKFKIVETYAQVNDLGDYHIILPPQPAGTSVTIYNLDHLGRNSRATKIIVNDVGPNSPVVYEVSNIEKSLSGFVPNTKATTYTITIKINNNVYETFTDQKGKFTFDFEEQLYPDQSIEVTAKVSVDGVTRYSYPAYVLVKNIKDYVTKSTEILSLNTISTDSYSISGTYMNGGTVYLAIGKKENDETNYSLHLLETEWDNRFSYTLPEQLEAGTDIYTMVRFTNGKILSAFHTTVILGIPNKPILVTDITNTDKTVKVIADKDCTVTLQIGSKIYESTEYIYNKVTGDATYNFAISRVASGTSVKITASNISGTGTTLKSKVVKVAPDKPTVATVKVGDKAITGKVELISVINTVIDASTATITSIANTETDIYAQIGSKIYKGTVDEKGNFTIVVPKQKGDTKISVWGSNKAGRGPITKVVVSSK